MLDIRCGGCNKLLARADYKALEIKCPRCKTMNNLQAVEPRSSALSASIESVICGKTDYSVDGR